MKRGLKSIICILGSLLVISLLNCKSQEKGLNPELLKTVEQHYNEWNFESTSLNDQHVVNFGFLRRTNKEPESSSLLIFLDGSGYQSAFGIKENGNWIKPGAPFGFGYSIFTEYDILVPEKPNVSIGGEHRNDRNVLGAYTMENRVQAAAAVIDSFLDEYTYSEVILLGVSEGGYILPNVYKSLLNKNALSALIIWGAGGMSQYDEFRWLAQSDISMPPELRQGYAGIEKAAEEIKANPVSIDMEFFGHPYQRWASFLWYFPLNDLKPVDIPILLIHGAQDHDSAVETSRMVEREFLESKKQNLTYIEYPEMGHGPESREEQEQLYKDLLKWLKNLQ